MPHLMVNLDDVADCRRAIGILTRQLGRDQGCAGMEGAGRRGRFRGNQDSELAEGNPQPGNRVAELPLPQKLKRIQSRGMWKHLVRIAESAPDAKSLPELDELLDLPKNKMRSLKAIMAKLENRFDIRFLKPDPDAGVDSAGNPRYIMLPNVRKQILRLVAE